LTVFRRFPSWSVATTMSLACATSRFLSRFRYLRDGLIRIRRLDEPPILAAARPIVTWREPFPAARLSRVTSLMSSRTGGLSSETVTLND
jgi:hypothetical protein